MTGLIIVAVFTLAFLMIATSVWLSGFWSGVITLINLILSGLIATSFYNPLALGFARRSPNVESGAIAEFLAIWLLFVLSFLLLRIFAELLTRHHLVLETWTDLIGRTLVAPAVSLVFCSFVLFTFHLAPMPIEGWWHDYFDRGSGGFGLSLDRGWGGYCRYASQGPLSENRWMGPTLAYAGRVYNDGGEEQVDFGIGKNLRIPTGVRFSPRVLPPLDDLRRAMARFRGMVASHQETYDSNFVESQGGLSASEAERQREAAKGQLQELTDDIRNSVQDRAFGLFQQE